MALRTLRLIFMGTPEFSVPTLKALMTQGMNVVGVYTQPPRPKGRHYHCVPSPVHEYAISQGIPVFTPLSLKSPSVQEEIFSLKPDLGVVVAYGLILPAPLLKGLPYGFLNIHGSLLPRWRGAAPIQRAIEAGDQISGVTIMKMDEGLDTGPLLSQDAWSLDKKISAGDLFSAMAIKGADLLIRTLAPYVQGQLVPVPQSEEGVTYAHKIMKEEAQLDWQEPAIFLERKIRALAPQPGAWFFWNGERFKVYAADVIPDIQGIPGTILDSSLTIACGQGALRLKTIQKPGGKPMEVQAYLHGSPCTVGLKV